MTEQIMGQDKAATFLGNAFREVALIGAGAKIPALGKALAGWQWTRSMVNLVCSPRSPEEYPGAVLDTVVLVLVLKGGPTSINVPRMNWSEMINSGGVASLGGVLDSYVIHLNTQALAGAVAGARADGLTVLLAQGQGSGSGSGSGGTGGGGSRYIRWPGGGPASELGAKLARNAEALWKSMGRQAKDSLTIAVTEVDGTTYITTNGGRPFATKKDLDRFQNTIQRQGWQFIENPHGQEVHAETHLYDELRKICKLILSTILN